MVRFVEIEGGFNTWKGRCKEAWGVMTGDPRMRATGVWDQVVGLCQTRAPDMMRQVDRWRQDLEREMRRRMHHN